MKKSLVLAMALAMGISATAFAANPFSDVPAGHWAYDSIAKLAAAGVVDGYGDNTYRGDRLMTRYEMAQIVAKAMAKGANVDRLASEFADELDSLGVRVAKLEKKSDNVKITGQIRYMNENNKIEYNGAGSQTSNSNTLRSRIFLTGNVNDNWNYVGMLENNHSFTNDMSVGGQKATTDEAGEGTGFQRAYLEGRLGGAKVTGGRFNLSLLDGIIYSTRADGLQASYGKKIRVGGFYVRPTNELAKVTFDGETISDYVDYDKAWGANVAADLGKNVTLRGGYTRFGNSAVGLPTDGIWNAGAAYHTNLYSIGFDYLKSNIDVGDSDVDTKGYVISATYRGAKPNKVGSYGLRAMYHHQGLGTFVQPSIWDDDQPAAAFLCSWQGFKGYSLRGDYTVAKNMVAAIEYYDFKGLEYSDLTSKTLAGHLMITF